MSNSLPKPACPNSDLLTNYCLGKLPDVDLEAIEAHLESCPSCQQTVDKLDVQADTFVVELRQPTEAAKFEQEQALQQALEAAQKIPAGRVAAKAPSFDPYYEWLGIPPAEQPPHHYRLLGLVQFESNANAIDNASDRQMAHIRKFQIGKHAADATKLLNEIARARICLLNAEKKRPYDQELRARISGRDAAAIQPSPTGGWVDGQMPGTADEFLQCLAASRLIDEQSARNFLQSLPPNSRPADAKGCATAFVGANLLTAYQARNIYQGHPHGLVIAGRQILDLLGKGGMGNVFKARYAPLDRIEAIKIIAPKKLDSVDAQQRFQREAKAAARLNHPNVVATYDAGEFDGVLYLAMEYVDGYDLARVIKDRGTMSVEHAVSCILQAATGLQDAHEQGIIHRDIKPHNLLLDQKGRVKILDLGLARFTETSASVAVQEGLTQSGQVMGTVDYMSPEQSIDAHSVGPAADVYSLGCTLHVLLTGKPPFAGVTAGAKLLAHHNTRAPSLCAARPEVSPALDAVFQRMLAKDVKDRFGSMAEVIAALRQLGTPAADPLPPPLAKALPDDSKLDVFLSQLAVSQDLPVIRDRGRIGAVAQPRGKPKPSRRRKVTPRLLIGSSIALVLTVILATIVVFSIKTPHGEFVVELADGVPADAVSVSLSQGGKQIDVIDKQDQWQISLAEGKYDVQLRGDAESFTIDKSSVTLRQNKRQIVKVSRIMPLAPRTINRGLVAELFEDGSLRSRVKRRIDPKVNFMWDGDGPSPGLPTDNFSVRWTGFIKAPVPGKYRFAWLVDDQAWLWIDDKLINQPERASSESIEVELDAQPHEFKLEFAEHGGSAAMYLLWQPPGAVRQQAVPDGVFFQDRESALLATVDASLLSGPAARPPLTLRVGETIDLLPLIDPVLNAVSGNWWFDGNSLMCGSSAGARLHVPVVPPAEYDIVVEAQHLGMPDALYVSTPAAGRQFGIHVDQGGERQNAGIEMYDGAFLENNSTLRTAKLIGTDRPVTLHYAVRKAGVTVTSEGKTIVDWKGDYRRCSIRPELETPSQRHLTLGAWGTWTRITKLQLIPRSTGPQAFPELLPRPPLETVEAPRDLPVGQWTDVLPSVDIAQDQVAGVWRRTDDGIEVEPSYSPAAHIELPVVLDGSYELEVEFTRHAGTDVICILAPVGMNTANCALSAWHGLGHGLFGVDKKTEPADLIGVKPGKLTSGERHRVNVTVVDSETEVELSIQLNGKEITKWRGRPDQLHVDGYYSRAIHRPLLTALSSLVTYHTAKVRPAKGTAYLLGTNRERRDGYHLGQPFGGTGGTRFVAVAPAKSDLVGFRFRTWEGETINAICPIFQKDKVRTDGSWCYSDGGTLAEVIAKEGYAVGGVELMQWGTVKGMRVVFMRTDGDRLKPSDRYLSPWFGVERGELIRLGGTGERIVGIHGSAGTHLDSLGLVYAKAIGKPSLAKERGPEASLSLTSLIPFRNSQHERLMVSDPSEPDWEFPFRQPYVARDGRMCKEFIYAHAPSQVEYDIPAGAKAFTAVGHCPLTWHVSFEVRVDGKLPSVSPKAGVVPIHVALPAGAKRLTLIVNDLGDNAADQSRWLFPRFQLDAVRPDLPADAPTNHVKCVELKPISKQVGAGLFQVNDSIVNVTPQHITNDEACNDYIFAHAPSHLSYAIPQGFKEFSVVGYNAEQGFVRFLVYIDEQPVFASRSEQIVPIRVRIPAGAKKLDLVADSGGDISRDWAMWCYPRFNREPSDNSPPQSVVRIVNKKSQKYLTVSGGTVVQQSVKPNAQEQEWIQETVGKHFLIRNRRTRLCLTVDHPGRAAQIVQKPHVADDPKFEWRLVTSASEWVAIENRATDFCLACSYAETDENVAIVQWTNENSDDQLWRIEVSGRSTQGLTDPTLSVDLLAKIAPNREAIHPDAGSPTSGLNAEYFAEVNLTQPVLTRRDPVVDFHWREGSPDPLVPSDKFSVRWQGWIKAPKAGAYSFRLLADDQASLYVDDKLVTQAQLDRESEFVDVQLTDQPHRIRIEQFETQGDAKVSLRWRRPGETPEEVVPSEALFTTLTAAKQANVVLPAFNDTGKTLEPFVLKVEGMPGITELRPEGTPPEAWREPGVFARMNGTGELRYPPVPLRNYVLEWTMRLDSVGGRFRVGGKRPSINPSAEFTWNGVGHYDVVFWDHAGNGWSYYNGGRTVQRGDVVNMKLIAAEGNHRLVFNDISSLGILHLPGDCQPTINVDWGDSLVTIFDAKVRPLQAEDMKWIGGELPATAFLPRAMIPVIDQEVKAGETVDLTERITTQLHDEIVSGYWSAPTKTAINVNSSAIATLRMPVDLREATEYKLAYRFTMQEGAEAIQIVLPVKERHFQAVVNGGGPASGFIFDDKSFGDDANPSKKPAMPMELNKPYDLEARVRVRDGKLTATVHVQLAGQPQDEPYLVLNDQPAEVVRLPDYLSHLTRVIDGSGCPAFQVHFSSGTISDVKLTVIEGSAKVLNWKFPDGFQPVTK